MNAENQNNFDGSNIEISLAVKIMAIIWMGAVLFIFLTTFGPPQFWELLEKIGAYNWFNNRYNEMFPFFSQVGSCNSFPRLICR